MFERNQDLAEDIGRRMETFGREGDATSAG
jgi:hypothetical protein